MTDVADSDTIIAPPAAWFQNGFHRFLESYLKRHFHAIAIDRSGWQACQEACADTSIPLIVYCNHPSWWDPLIAHFINRRLFGPRQFYAPIAASALEKYKVFERLGFFGVETESSRGAASFLRTTAELFRREQTSLWLTPEGRFADARDHSAELMPGLPHLCSGMSAGIVVPLSLEYVFWEERLPECLLRIGEVVSLAELSIETKSQWAGELTKRLRENQSQLATLAIARCSEPFDNLLCGKQGVSGVYDFGRRLKSWLSFRRFHAAHGKQFGESSGE